MRRPGDPPCEKRPLESPAEHFKRCGPFCISTRFCERCADIFGLCAMHAGDADSSVFWVIPPGRKGRRRTDKMHRRAK